jgi:hypothetical protein
MTGALEAVGRRSAGSHPGFGVLLRWVPRAGHPAPVGAAAVGAVAFVAWSWRDLETLDRRLWMVRLGCVMVVLGALYLLDDPGRRSTEAAVTTHRRRTAVRLVAVAGITAAAFVVLATLASLRGGMGTVLGGVAVEVAAVATVGVVVTLWLQRTRDLDEPATPGAMTLLALLAVVPVVDLRWPLLADPGPQWPAAHLRWAAVACAAAVTLVWVTRDPATTLRGLVRTLLSRPLPGSVGR